MNKETLRMQMLAGIITEGQYKAKLNENITAEELFQMFKDEDLLNDRRYYDVEDLMSAYPDLSQEEAEKLEQMLQNAEGLNEEKYAEPMVMIQNIVDNWSDGGIDAEPAMMRINKILMGNYEDESGEGFNGDIKQDILDFWGTQQDDAAQSDGEYEAEWDTEFFTNEYPEYKGREEEINTLIKTLKIK
jgi:hypothetical protein